MSEEQLNTDNLADLSILGDGTSTAADTTTGEAVNNGDPAFGMFIDSTLGYIAAIGLSPEEFKEKATEFAQTATYLKLGENFSKLTSLTNVSPTQALIAGVVLFGITVVISRPDIQKKIGEKIGMGKKKVGDVPVETKDEKREEKRDGSECRKGTINLDEITEGEPG